MSATLDKKKWCVMVYFAADVDLESAALADLEQMKVAGSSSEVDLLAQLNPGGSRPIRRYHLQKDTYLQEDLIPTIDPKEGEHFLNNVNARKDLVDFVQWCADRSDAEHYALILWGHGQGWQADNPDPCFLPGAGNPRKSLAERIEQLPSTDVPIMSSVSLSLPVTLLNGDTGFLTNNDLREALADAKKILHGRNIDLLGLDACLMAMAEICCQIQESVDYLVACEDTVPDESWPYDSILKVLVANANRISAEDLARVIVWKFIFDFGQKRKFVTQSICRLGGDNGASLKKFTTALERLVATMLVEIKDPETRWAAMIARSQVQSFYLRDYVDLFDYCRLLTANSKSPAVNKACQDVMDALRNENTNNNGSPGGLVIDNGTYGYPLKCSFGVSVYFPCVGQVPPCYAELEFCKQTRWHEFLDVFLHSPDGRTALFESTPPIVTETESEWPNVIPDMHPEAAPAAQPAIIVEGVPATAAVQTVAAATTASDVDVTENDNHTGNGFKTTLGDVIKTTLGDVIKTSHGDPIKRPQLPTWMLPSAPKVNATIAPDTKSVESRNCGCKP